MRIKSESHEGLEDELDNLIKKFQAETDEYSHKVEQIKSTNMDVFRLIKSTSNAPAKAAPRQVQSASQAPLLAGFKLNSNLKPAYLVNDCTLKEVTKFSKTFANYMKAVQVQTSQQMHYGDKQMSI